MQIKDSKIGSDLPAFIADDDNFIINFLYERPGCLQYSLGDKGYEERLVVRFRTGSSRQRVFLRRNM